MSTLTVANDVIDGIGLCSIGSELRPEFRDFENNSREPEIVHVFANNNPRPDTAKDVMKSWVATCFELFCQALMMIRGDSHPLRR